MVFNLLNASGISNILVTLLSFTLIVLGWALPIRESAVNQDTLIKSGSVVIYHRVYLMTAYINFALICGVAVAGKLLCWTEVHNLLSHRYQTRESIHGFSKAIHAYADNILTTAVAILDPRVMCRGRLWAFTYLICFAVAVFNALVSTALPQLLQKNVSVIRAQSMKIESNSTYLDYQLRNGPKTTQEDSYDEAVFLGKVVYDGKYLWEVVHQDAYTASNRSYTYISTWGHASPENSTDRRFAMSSPANGTVRSMQGLDGYLTAITCQVVPCGDCGTSTNDSSWRYGDVHKFGLLPPEFVGEDRDICQYRVFWGYGNGSGITVSMVNKTDVVREAIFIPVTDVNTQYEYEALQPGMIKVNCKYSFRTNNGLGNTLYFHNSSAFDKRPFADYLFEGVAIMDPGTVRSMFNERNILRNLTYNMHNSVRLYDDKLFRTDFWYKDVPSGNKIEWVVETDIAGYDFSIVVYATISLAAALLIYLIETLVMLTSRHLQPLISYTQEIDTRLSVVAISGTKVNECNNCGGGGGEPQHYLSPTTAVDTGDQKLDFVKHHVDAGSSHSEPPKVDGLHGNSSADTDLLCLYHHYSGGDNESHGGLTYNQQYRMELEYLHKVRQQTFASAEEGPASTDSSATTVMFPEPTCVEPMGSRSDDDIRNAHFGQLQQRGASFASVATPRCPEVPVSVSLSEFGTEYVNLPSVIQQAKSIISRGNNRASGRRRRLRSSTITTGVGAAAQLQRVRNSRQRVYRNRIANAAAYQVASYPAAALPAASGNELARGTIEDCRLHRLDSLVVGFRSAGTCAAGGGSADRDKATAVRNNSYPSGRSPP